MSKITVPLILLNVNDDGIHLQVKITIAKKKYIAIVDTGASRTVFNNRVLEAITGEIIVSENLRATSMFSSEQPIQAVLPKIKIGKLTILDYPAVGLDLDHVNEVNISLGLPRVDAVLGGDILNEYGAEISYQKLEMSFRKTS